MDISALTGLLPLITVREGIKAWGTRSFVDATHRALGSIAGTEQFALVKQQIRMILQQPRAADRVKWGTGKVFVGPRTWRLSPIEYGAELIRAAARHEKYSAGVELGDPDTEYDCFEMSFNMLRELGATDDILGRSWRRMFEKGLRFVHSFEERSHVVAMCTARRFLRARARGRAAYDSIALEGCCSFLQNTEQALALLLASSRYSMIRKNIAAIKEMGWKHRAASCLAMIDVHLARPHVHVAASLGERGPPLRYAGCLAHEAFHNQLFSEGKPYVGAEAERRCLEFQADVLRELDAPAELIEELRILWQFPLGTLEFDERYWEQFDWRGH